MELKRFRYSHVWGACAGLSCLVSASQAMAAGLAIRNQSASGMGTGLASDTVNAYDASGVFANPAVMGSFKGQNFSVGLDYVSANIKAKNAALTNTGPTGAATPNPNQGKTSVDDVSDPVVIPSIFGVHEVNEAVRIGWGVTVPWATNTKYDETWSGRYYATKTDLRVTEFTLAGSYAVNEMIDLGLALNVQKADGKLNSMVDLGLLAYSANPSATTAAGIGRLDVLSKYEADSTAYGFQFGILAKPTPELRIGLSYRSSVEHKAKGSLKFEGTNPTAAGTLAAIQASASPSAPKLRDSDDAKLDLKLPTVVSLGAAYALDAFTYYANATYTAWKTFDAFVIEYNGTSSTTELDWKNSLYIALGADYRLNKDVTLRAGLSKDQGVTDDNTRTPRTPDNDRTGLALGVGYQASDMVKISAAYQKLFLPKTKVDLSDQAYPDAAGRGNLTADYEFNPNLFMASVDVML